jgi:hypothetical protein
MSKKDELISGKVTKLRTGKNWDIQFQPFFTDLIMMAIVKIGEITVQPDARDLEPSQITVDVLALDSLGFVYEATLVFTTTKILRKKKLISDMKKDAICLIKGRYGICENNIIIFDPKYIPLPPVLKEKEVRKIFKVNGNPLAKN